MKKEQFTEVYMDQGKPAEETLFDIESGSSLRHPENMLDEDPTIELLKSTRDNFLVWKDYEY